MVKNLSKIAKAKKIRYFLISFVDLFGVLRSKLVPTEAIDEMQKNGAGFAGFATWLDMSPADTDMFAIPDPDSLIQLPWNKEVGWLASDLWMGGKPVKASPRVMLKEQMNKLNLYEKIYVLDNQYCDMAALNKSIILAENGNKVFIWPKELKQFKDFNDVCVIGNKDKIKPEFILKNTHSGLKAKLLLTEIKNS